MFNDLKIGAVVALEVEFPSKRIAFFWRISIGFIKFRYPSIFTPDNLKPPIYKSYIHPCYDRSVTV